MLRRIPCPELKSYRDSIVGDAGQKSITIWVIFQGHRSSIWVAVSGIRLAITEVDDLFGHEPLHPRWVALIEKYYARSIEEGIHRFQSYAHVCQILSERGWCIDVDRKLEDDELCFVGAASSEVLEAWRTRLSFMMPRFLERFGDEAIGFDSAFLECLASKEHRSRSRVWFILARRPVIS